ncbi:hypothetical protein GCM10022406_02730 [Hymenobacter algoricola]|uniref:Uncharacterized protein n=1 Tax=Hymenobacter algoricola TaxID=486267 RepID=A0ABP7MFJ3_9BACT
MEQYVVGVILTVEVHTEGEGGCSGPKVRVWAEGPVPTSIRAACAPAKTISVLANAERVLGITKTGLAKPVLVIPKTQTGLANPKKALARTETVFAKAVCVLAKAGRYAGLLPPPLRAPGRA